MQKVMRSLLSFIALLCTVLFALTGSQRAAAASLIASSQTNTPQTGISLTAAPQADEPASAASQTALLLADTASSQELLALANRLRQAGATPLATFPNQGMLVKIHPAQAGAIRAIDGVRLLALPPTAPMNEAAVRAAIVSEATAGGDSGAQTAAGVWNQMVREAAGSQAAPSPTAGPGEQPDGEPAVDETPATPPALPDNDVRIAPRPASPPLAAPGTPSLPNLDQTSEFMLYDVNVDVFLVESNSSSPNSETWTTAARDLVQAEITNGLTWWVNAATNGGRPSANLTFNINFHTPWNDPAVVSTSYEPIQLTFYEESLWINQVYNNLGYHSSIMSDNAFSYNHDRRTANGTDWSITIFVVNSIKDTDGMFAGPSSYFAYAYLNGPFMVMTYDNDGWGINRMEVVTAHETSHLFGGLDEYTDSGCTKTEVGGYLGVPNTNCENGGASETSIMRSSANQETAYATHAVSTPVRAMVGWRDSDNDRIYDPIDTTPTITLNGSGTTLSFPNSTATLTGSTSDPAWPPAFPHYAANINNIQAVQYRLNGGAWTACSASDGIFDETGEDYSCALSGLGNGPYTVEVRAANRSGNLSAEPYPSLTLVNGNTAGPTGSIIINGGADYITTTSASLALSASDAGSGISQMRFSNNNSSWSAWEPFAASKTWTLSSGEGTKTVYVQYKNTAGNVSATYSDTIVLDMTAPAGTVSVNNGAAYTISTNVNLALSASDAGSGVAQMRFSNNSTTWSTWEAYAPSKQWSLAAGEGLKTIYAQFKNSAGLVSSSVTDQITVDTTAPTGSFTINSSAAYTSSRSVSLALKANDALSGEAEMRFSNDNILWQTWEPFAASKEWVLAPGDGSKTVYAQLKDAAGNSSASFTGSIILDTAAPSAALSINGGAAYTNATTVTLDLAGSDPGSGVGAMRLSNDGVSWAAWEEFANSLAWALESGDGSKTVYLQLRDRAGSVSPAVSAGILLDTIAPQVTVDSALLLNGVTSVSWSALESGSGQVVFDVQFRIGFDGAWVDWLTGTTQTSASFGPQIPGSSNSLSQDEQVFFRVRGRDAAGNTSEYIEQVASLPAFSQYLPVTIR